MICRMNVIGNCSCNIGSATPGGLEEYEITRLVENTVHGIERISV
jgi:hypothetical protein